MKLIEITEDIPVNSDEIKGRIVQSKKNAYTQHYLIMDNEDEIAFLSLDLMYDRKLLFLYELFVINSKRKKGYGSKIMDLVFEFAKNQSFAEVYLDPNPFDGSITLDVLKRFYIKKGFKIQEETSQMVKKITNS